MTGAEPDAEMLRRARHVVYERLALLTAVIWVLGTLFLVITTVPVVERPVREFARAMTIPIVPAALPWLTYPFLSRWLARRWARRGQSAPPD